MLFRETRSSSAAAVGSAANEGNGFFQSARDALGALFGKSHPADNGAAQVAAPAAVLDHKSYDDQRSERARVWADTHQLTLQGSYINRQGQHRILQYQSSRPFKVTGCAGAIAAEGPRSISCTDIVVENKDCLHAAQERVARNLRTRPAAPCIVFL